MRSNSWVCVWVFCVAADASAFVCSRSSLPEGGLGPSLYWADRNIGFTLGSVAAPGISKGTSDAVFRASFQVWENMTVGEDSRACARDSSATDIVFIEQPRVDDFPGFNEKNPASNRNLLLFQNTRWVYGASTIALTSTTYNVYTGEILDADIEFNEVNRNFTASDTRIGTDLKNAAVHEIGHLLGFDHSGEAQATMAANAVDQETLKRDLHCDDVSIMLLRYPAGKGTGYCRSGQDLEECGHCVAPTGTAFGGSPGSGADSGSGPESGGGCQSVSSVGGFWCLAVWRWMRGRYKRVCVKIKP